MNSLTGFPQAFWGVLAAMSPWLLGGFLLAGILGVLVPRTWVQKIMGRSRGGHGVLNAVLLGVPLPICSCGVLPLSAGLRKAGAGKGATAGFLIATPQTGLDSIAATYALMGPTFALARPLAAAATGLLGGFAVDLVDRSEDTPPTEEPKKHCCCCCSKHQPTQTHTASAHTCCHAADTAPQDGLVTRVLKSAFVDLLGDVSRPLTIGLVISALVAVFVPDSFFAETLGSNDWLAMPVMVLVGFPMYICSTAAIPIAATLVLKGLSPGAAFVFLMVGPAINAASVATVAQLIGRRATLIYVLVIAGGALVCGVLMNQLPFNVTPQVATCCVGEHTTLLQHICGGVLTTLILFLLVRPLFKGRVHVD